MAFYVRDSSRNPAWHVGDFLLDHNSWNDWWRYENLYTLKYMNKDHIFDIIGYVKIGDISEVQNAPVPALPDHFERLDPTMFISVGQDDEYYEAINRLGLDKRLMILTSLNDMAFNLDYFYSYRQLDVVRTSLLRDIPIQTVINQFHRMACGGAKTTDYKFAYHYPSSGSSELEPAQLSFSVEPDSNPPTNIHVVIGRNGVGKTWLFKNMIGSLYHKDNASTFGEFTFDSHRTQFSNLVCLAFSAFDHFPLAQENDDDLKYTYIGIKSLYDGKEVGLDEQFAISLTTCMTNKTLYQRWKDTISVLNSDTIFSEVNLIECTDRIQANRRVYTRKLAETEIIQIFKRLSSGHKIVVLTLTRLVETVKECTLVLLDEPELHLHPPLLAAFTHALSQLLINRNGVAIVATHSPVILQEVPKSCVWVLRRSGREIVADRPERETFGENVGILTSDVFRLEVMDSGFHKMLKDVLEKANGDFEQALAKFNLQLGSEAIALIKVMSLQYGDDL